MCWPLRTTTSRCSNGSARASDVRSRSSGDATLEPRLIVDDEQFHNAPVDLPMAVLFGNVPKLQRSFARRSNELAALDLPRVSLGRFARSRAAFSGRRLETVSDHDRRSQHHRLRRARSDGRTVAGAGCRCGGDDARLQDAARRSDGDGRTLAARVDRSGRVGADGDRRSADESRVGGSRGTRPCRVVGELDGGGRSRQRGSGVVRRGYRRWDGAVPRVGHRDSGRQRQLVDAHAVARRARRTFRNGADDVDRIRVRAGARRSQSGDAGVAARSRAHATVAGRSRRRCKSTRRQRAGADASATG